MCKMTSRDREGQGLRFWSFLDVGGKQFHYQDQFSVNTIRIGKVQLINMIPFQMYSRHLDGDLEASGLQVQLWL